jgi:hypothetical protein
LKEEEEPMALLEEIITKIKKEVMFLLFTLLGNPFVLSRNVFLVFSFT